MKKIRIISAVICILSLASFGTGCAHSEGNGDGGTKLADNTEVVHETKYIVDRDDEGALILTSSDGRLVYLTEPGTYVILYTGDSGVSKIMIVKDFKTSEDAANYVANNGKSLLESGEYSNLRVEGRYVTYSPTLSSEKYGRYYAMSMSDLSAAFSSYELQ